MIYISLGKVKSKRVIVSVINDLNTDQRVHKVCTYIQSRGYEVLLVGRKKKDSQVMEERPYHTKRFNMLFEKGPLFYAFFNLRLFAFLIFRKADILVANDLDTLLPNYLISRLKKTSLVYDSHEYFTEVPELIARPKVQAIWERIEKWIFPKLKQVSTVNNSIAARYQEKYNVRLQVVRNVSPKYNPITGLNRADLGLPNDKILLIMQGAGLNIDRGVEEAIRAMPYLENCLLIIVGDGDIIPAMKEMVRANRWENHVNFFGKRPYPELMKFTQLADFGLSFDQPTNPNYLYSLPNKVFDYIHTTTPIFCSNVVEVSKLITNYNIGAVISDFSPESLANSIRECISNKDLVETWKANCKHAADQECWEKEVENFAVFYPKL